MCRKLTLTGWVLVVAENHEELRLLVAILVTVAFLSVHLTIRPHKRFVSEQCKVCFCPVA